MCPCFGQCVDMGERGKKMCVCVWDKVWIWERDEGRFVTSLVQGVDKWGREEGRCVAVFGTWCGYGGGKKRNV